MAARIVRVVEELPAQPRVGRVVPEFNDPDLRERIVGSYRVMCRLTPEAVRW